MKGEQPLIENDFDGHLGRFSNDIGTLIRVAPGFLKLLLLLGVPEVVRTPELLGLHITACDRPELLQIGFNQLLGQVIRP